MPDSDNPQLTPEQAGAAAAQVQAAAIEQSRQAQQIDSLDIRDPSARPQPKSEPEATPEAKPAESKAIPGNTVESWPDHLLRAAWEAGLGMDEAKSFGTPANLERALNLAARRATTQSPPPAEPPSQQPEEELPFEYSTGEEGVFTEEGAKWFQERDRYFAEQQKQLRAELAESKKQNEQIMQHLQRQQEEKLTRDWNDFIVNKTPEEYRELIGKSFYQSNQEQAQNQSKMFNVFRSLVDGANQPFSEETYLTSLRAAFPDVVKKATDGKIVERARNAEGQFLAKPTAAERAGDSRARGQTDAQKTSAAERAVEAELRRQGMTVYH